MIHRESAEEQTFVSNIGGVLFENYKAKFRSPARG